MTNMTAGQWALIAALTLGAYAVRVLGLLGGEMIARNARLKAILSDVPGCLLVALIASSLVEAPVPEWIAAAAAVIIAILSRSVLITMIGGFTVLTLLNFW